MGFLIMNVENNNCFGILPNQELSKSAFIAGQGNGIVTVVGKPERKRIILLERRNLLPCVRQTWSFRDGSYVFEGLNPDTVFMVIAVDDQEKYEPVAWDFIKAAIRDA